MRATDSGGRSRDGFVIAPFRKKGACAGSIADISIPKEAPGKPVSFTIELLGRFRVKAASTPPAKSRIDVSAGRKLQVGGVGYIERLEWPRLPGRVPPARARA